MIIPRRLHWLWLTLAVALFDRATKAWIESRPPSYFPHSIFKHVDLVFSQNPGIAFSFLAGANSQTVRLLLVCCTLLIIGVLAWLLVTSRAGSANLAGLALLLAGAAGNLTDRIVHGAVTDFLQVWVPFLPWAIFHPWPTFNAADAAVTVGALLIVFDVLFGQKQAVLPTK